MTPLTHAQARYTLHVGRESFDDAVQSKLKQHLIDCADCRTYVDELTTLRASLSRAMHARWDRHHAPADLAPRIQTRVGRKTIQRQVLNLSGSMVAISALIILAGVLIWVIGVTGPGNGIPSGPSAAGGAAVTSVPTSTVPFATTSTPIPGLATFGENLSLVDVDVAETRVMAGSTIRPTLRWQAQAAMTASYTAFVQLRDAEGNLVAQSDSIPGARPTTNWSPGETVDDPHQLVLPDDLATGRYELVVGVYDAANGTRLLTDNGESIVRFATIDVQSISHRVGEDFGDFATLLGFDLANDRLAPGAAVEMTLYWRARAQTATSYTVSVQVFGENKTIVAQADRVPANGSRPTTGWQPGEIIVDPSTLQLPADLPSGSYSIVLTMYDSASGAPVFTGSGNGAVVLTTLEVVSAIPPTATPLPTRTPTTPASATATPEALPASPIPPVASTKTPLAASWTPFPPFTPPATWTPFPPSTSTPPSSSLTPPATWTPFPPFTSTPPSSSLTPPATPTPTSETGGPTPLITFTPPPTPPDSLTPFPTFTPTP